MQLEFLIGALSEYYDTHGDMPVFVGSNISAMSPLRSVGLVADDHGDGIPINHKTCLHFSPKDATDLTRL